MVAHGVSESNNQTTKTSRKQTKRRQEKQQSNLVSLDYIVSLFRFVDCHVSSPVYSIMDGHFVPNLTFGPPVIASLRKAQPNAYIDCHLMVTDPANWVAPLAKAGASGFTFHLEANMPESGGVTALIDTVRETGMKVGLVIKPKTPVEELFPYIDSGKIDLVLIMTVEPGFSGQKFMADQMPKIAALRAKYPHLDIQVDGGVGPATIETAAKAGANVVVAASAIFGSDDRQGVINTLRKGVEDQQQQSS